MKTKRALLAVAILIAVPVVGQEVEHAPTAAQCQADQALWLSKLQEPAKDWAHSVVDTSVLTLTAWGDELNACSVVDPVNENKYTHTVELTLLVMGSRKADFITRHGLTRQFFDEDLVGKR